MNICIRNKGLITGNIRNRGNNESSKRYNCSVHQGTKVSSAKERNQDILSPQRVSQQVHALSPSRVIQSALRKLGIPRRSQHSPAHHTDILKTSIPGSLDLKIVPRRYIKHSMESLPQYSSKLPQENPIQFPRKG